MIKRLLAVILAVLLPPLSVFIVRGMGAGFVVNVILFVAGIGIFFGLYAAPGLLVYGLAILHAFILALLPARRAALST
ncbi:YqaE/Pmp3 family membrane protein [uncultured Tistrella sp.]|uniref:YqaE/Pmp3 family membrane protein n=1 Tax=Tistrella mobilis TaxID=171437 RepID=UPI000C09771C|nr:YqaE/Pmp3 family membrane protein [uncultured Tistrella sp.]MAM72346.1 hypothetical protein [Tistrella sp.]